MARMRSEALLAGRIFDDRGNRMTPSHVRKRGVKYRYYLSSHLLQAKRNAQIDMPGPERDYIEGLVTRWVREHLEPSEPIDESGALRRLCGVDPAGRTCAPAMRIRAARAQGADTLDVPWRKKTAVTRRREMLLPISDPPHQARPIRSETRATLIASIAQEDAVGSTSLCECKHERGNHRGGLHQVNMTISLAFLAPDLVKAPKVDCHGIGVTRLRDAPVEWSRQQRNMGLIG